MSDLTLFLYQTDVYCDMMMFNIFERPFNQQQQQQHHE